MVTIEKATYGEWGQCVRLTNGSIELYATLDFGPRVIRFGYVGGQNLFCEDSKVESSMSGPDMDERYGEAMTETMGRVAEFVTQVLQEPDFVLEMRKSAESRFDYRWMLSTNLWAGVSVAVWIVLILGTLCGYLVLKGKIPPKEEPKFNVFREGLDG